MSVWKMFATGAYLGRTETARRASQPQERLDLMDTGPIQKFTTVSSGCWKPAGDSCELKLPRNDSISVPTYITAL